MNARNSNPDVIAAYSFDSQLAPMDRWLLRLIGWSILLSVVYYGLLIYLLG